MATLQDVFDNPFRRQQSLWYARSPERGVQLDTRREGEREIEADERQHSITLLLHRWSQGDQAAAAELAAIVEDQLLVLAMQKLKGQPDGHTLGPVDLINEAWIKLTSSGQSKEWNDRTHFLRVASRAMRSILIDHARKKNRLKHKAPGRHILLDTVLSSYESRAQDLLALNEALERLRAVNSNLHDVVVHRFYGGYTVIETAEVMAVSVRQVERLWTAARAWLRSQLE
ncbi:MAG: ECF-type sigma factor [Planctomycetota bacterium]